MTIGLRVLAPLLLSILLAGCGTSVRRPHVPHSYSGPPPIEASVVLGEQTLMLSDGVYTTAGPLLVAILQRMRPDVETERAQTKRPLTERLPTLLSDRFATSLRAQQNSSLSQVQRVDDSITLRSGVMYLTPQIIYDVRYPEITLHTDIELPTANSDSSYYNSFQVSGRGLLHIYLGGDREIPPHVWDDFEAEIIAMVDATVELLFHDLYNPTSALPTGATRHANGTLSTQLLL